MTLPLSNSVAVCDDRAVAMLPAELKVPWTGSYSSTAEKAPALLEPPAIKTVPLFSSVAVWAISGVNELLMGVNVPDATS